MKIGELARATGVTLRTIRYYEELGLIKPSKRSPGGFRLFSESDTSRIKLIHFLKSMNLSLDKTKELLSSKKQGTKMGEVVKKLLPELDSYAETAQREIDKYQKIKDDIEKTTAMLQKCIDCEHIPSEFSCKECGVLASNGEFPLAVRLIA